MCNGAQKVNISFYETFPTLSTFLSFLNNLFQVYLKKFGYYHDNRFAAENTKTSQAIADFQRTFNLPVIGKLDDGTTTLMKTPRCGVTDHQNQGYSFAKWNQFHLLYNYDNYTPDLGKGETKRLTERAFKYWADVTPLKFTEHRGFGNILIQYDVFFHRCLSKYIVNVS